jgi:hypothetical protein
MPAEGPTRLAAVLFRFPAWDELEGEDMARVGEWRQGTASFVGVGSVGRSFDRSVSRAFTHEKKPSRLYFFLTPEDEDRPLQA